MSLKSIGVLTSLLLFGAAPAWAGITITPGTLDPSNIFGSFSLFTGDQTTFGQELHNYAAPVSVSDALGVGGATASGSLVITSSPTPSILSSVTLNGGTHVAGTAQGGASGGANYSFQILGAPGTATVRVDAIGSLGFSALPTVGSSSGQAFEQFQVREANNGPVLIDEFLLLTEFNGVAVDESVVPAIVATIPTLGFTIGADFTLFTNTVYDVVMRASASGSTTGGQTESVFANLDPTFRVDGPFTVEVSPGFGGVTVNAPGAGGVPEPAAWAMMLIGFGAIGALARRRTLPLPIA